MKTLPFNLDSIQAVISEYPTPFHIYDEKGIRASARKLDQSFSWAPGFKNFYAVKALPNPATVEILKQEGMGIDCSSLAELVIADKLGFKDDEIMFSSNDTAAEDFVKANELGAIINLDDISHIAFLETCLLYTSDAADE